MYKNYWLRRKAIREDVLVDYSKTLVAEKAYEKKWKRIEIMSSCGTYLIMKENYERDHKLDDCNSVA